MHSNKVVTCDHYIIYGSNKYRTYNQWVRIMDEIILEKHLVEVPSVIINAINPLNDKKCWGVYIVLLKNDEGLRFNQIKDQFKGESAEISRVLKKLSNAGLVAKNIRNFDDIGNIEAAYYVSTPLGKKLMRALYEGLLPKKNSHQKLIDTLPNPKNNLASNVKKTEETHFIVVPKTERLDYNLSKWNKNRTNIQYSRVRGSYVSKTRGAVPAIARAHYVAPVRMTKSVERRKRTVIR